MRNLVVPPVLKVLNSLTRLHSSRPSSPIGVSMRNFILSSTLLLLVGSITITLLLFSCGEQKAKTPKFYLVQVLKGHPVHQLSQIAFKEGCTKVGFVGEILATDNYDVQGTIALIEQALARGDAKGFVILAVSPAYNPIIEKIGRAGIPVILPHFPAAEGSIPGASGIICCDSVAYARVAAQAIGKAIGGKGQVAITQGSFNPLENLVVETFSKELQTLHPEVKVLKPEEETFDPSKAIAKASAILQANPEVVAAFSTTGGGAMTWARAQRDTGRKITIIAMDYTRVNLDLVKKGEVLGVIGQPLWDENFGAAELLVQVGNGTKIAWWTKLDAPLITKDNLAPFEAILDKVEAAIKK